MLKYASVIDENTKRVAVAIGDDIDFYQSIGMVEMEVEKAYTGEWYIIGYAPVKPAPTRTEIEAIRRQLYINEKDPITCQIESLKDEQQTPEIIAEIEALKIKRAEIVEQIKNDNPYPEETA